MNLPRYQGTEITKLLSMADGQPLFVRDTRHAQAHDAVLIVHGLGEHSGRYKALTEWLLARGYSVRSYDQRGHGQSPGPRGAIKTSADLVDDLAAVYANYAKLLPRPPLLLGHSMGGLVAARCVLDRRIQPAALILSSPALRAWASPALRKLATTLSRIAPNLPLHNGLPFDKLSHDPAVEPAYRKDPLRHGKITPRLAEFIFRAGENTIADASLLRTPTLLLVAGSDKLVDPSGSREFSEAAWSTHHLTTRYFDALYHELFNEAEPGRSQVLKQLSDWLQKRA